MASVYNEETYQSALDNLMVSRENLKLLQQQFEAFLNNSKVNPETAEWIKGHRDYLSVLEVAFLDPVEKKEPTIEKAASTEELLKKWQAELKKQLTLLGSFSYEVQGIVDEKFSGTPPLKEGESRRLGLALKDVMEANRFEQQDSQTYGKEFLTLAFVQQSNVEPTTEKKGFLARLFGK